MDPTSILPQDTPSNDGVSLGTPQPPADGVSIASPIPTAPALPQNVVMERSAKVSEGIGQHIGLDYDTIVDEMQSGREKTLRDMATSKMNADNYQRKLGMVADLANKSDKPLDENEVRAITDPFNPANRPLDANSIVEREFSKKYIGSIQDAVDSVKSVPLTSAQQEIPETYNETLAKGDTLTAKLQVLNTMEEDYQAAAGKQGIIGNVADFAKNLFQPYVEMKVRGNVGYTAGLGLGSALHNKANEVFSLNDLDEFGKQARTIGDNLAKDNPSLALQWVEYLKGNGNTALDNLFTGLMPVDYAGIFKGAGGLARRIDLNRRTNTAVRQMVEASERVGADQGKRAEAAGDINTASDVRATDLISKDIAGARDPIEMTKEPLLTNMKMDQDAIGAAPGNLAGEQVRRIQDQYEANGTSLIQRIIDAVRINRTPMAVATRDAVQVLKNATMDYFPGIRNAILDVSNPLYEPRSNTYWHEVTFGNYDGSLFSNEKTAKNFADIHGLNADVLPAEGPITNAQTQKILTDRVSHQKNIDLADQGVQEARAKLADDKLGEDVHTQARSDLDFFSKQKKGFQAKLDETDLRLKGGSTYDRVTTLQNEINQFQVTNKNLRASMKDETQYPKGSAVRDHVSESIKFAKAQILQKNEEIQALREGTASTIGARTDTVQQHGVGFKIVVRRPMVETDHAVRDLLIRDTNGKLISEATSTSSQQGYKSLLNAALWRFRGADDTLAINESIQRKVGTYTQSLFKEWASQEAGYIRQLASGVIREDPVTGAPIPYWKAKPRAIMDKITGKTHSTFNDFNRTLEYARTARDKDGNVGYFFQSPGELNDFYQRSFQREATFPEHQAYFAFTRMVEGDRIFREISEFRNRARLGMEQFQLKVRGADGVNSSDWFDARRLKKFPGGDDVMMILGRRDGDEKLVNLGGAGLSPTTLEKLRDDVEKGRKTALELYAPEHTPLRGFVTNAKNEHVRYVITDTAASKPIEFNHVNRRGGGHFEYDYDHFLKQAKMYHQYENIGGVQGKYKSVYTGDTTFMPLLNRAMGQNIADILHTVQGHIRDGNLERAKTLTENTLPIEWEKLHGMFKPGRDELGRQTPPQLDLNEKFVVVPRGKTVLDMDKNLADKYGNTFKNAATSGSLNKQFQVAFNTERDSEGIKHFMDVGTPGNPIYKYAPETKFIDPISTMNRSLNRIVQSVFMDDYKMYAVEHWLREAEEHLEPIRAKLARTSPNWVFTSSIDKSAFRNGTPWETVANLLSNRYKIQQFTGIPSTFDTALNSAKQTLVDWAYNKFGPEQSRSLGARATLLVPNWILGGGIKDPVTFLRSMTFHEKLGLFNPAQLLVQAQTYATILAMSPRNGVSGSMAAMLHGWSRMNRSEENLVALDRLATKMDIFGQNKWRPGEFKEAMEHGERTGFFNVAGEYANLNTALKTDFVGNDFKSFLNAGTWFFKQGEQSTRVGAWYTAFREFREARPAGALSRDDLGKILQRADLLTANMSRASNSALQSGVLSLTSQFLTYQMRLAEMMLGNRLTGLEKTRMLSFYAALYGAPSAIGLYGLPLTNSIREEAINRGYVVGDNWLSTAVDQGLPAIAAAIITGKGDFRKGNNYNIGARYGSPGFTQFADAMKSDAPWWQLLAGASGSSLINSLSSTNSFFHAMAAWAFRPNNEKPYPLMASDIIDMAKEVSSVNQAWKIYMAINAGKWMSKNEGYIGDVSIANSLFMGTLGLSPQQQDDMYLKKDIKKNEQEYQKYVMSKSVEELRRGYENQKEGNRTGAVKNFIRAQSLIELGGFPKEQIGTIYSTSVKGMEGMINDEDYKLASDKVPETHNSLMGIPMPFNTQTNIPQTRMQQFKTQLQLNDYKKQ